MTTVPLDDPGDGGAASVESATMPKAPPVRSDSVGEPEPFFAEGTPWWSKAVHPIRAWEATGRRWLPGFTYPVALWALWRVAHLLTSVYLGGEAINTAYNYDGIRYLDILHFGYTNPRVEMPNVAFFPGISWLAWPVYQVTKSNAWSAHLTVSLTGIAAFVAVWGVSKAWKSEAVARKAVWLLALFPSSLFLWAFYSEGLFIALGAGAVWADRRNKRWLAALLFMALSTTRTVAIIIPAVIILARIIRQRRVDRWCFVYAGAAVLGAVPVLYMMRYYTGNPFAFIPVQADWGRSLSWPWVTIGNGIENLYPKPDTIMVPALVARNFDLWCLPIIFLGVGYLAFWRRDPFPMEAWMLGVALIALPLCSTSLASFNRFAFADWVIYPAYASFLCRLPTWWRRACWTAIVVSLAFTTYAMVGRYSVDRFVG